MNRLLRIVIYGVVLFLVYLWISSVAQSCNRPGSVPENNTEESSGDVALDQEIYNEYFETDAQEELEPTPGEEYQEYIEEDYEEPETNSSDYIEPDYEDYNEPELAQTPQNKNTSLATKYSGVDGKYLIITGSYLIRDNAEQMVKKLKGLGYADAQIINFELSQYHSVTAGRYGSYDEASQLARAIQNKGIDCYVHTRK